MKQMLKFALIVGFLTSVLLVTAPPAAAQGPAPVLSIDEFKEPTGAVKPETSKIQATFKIKYSMQTPAQGGVIAVAQTVVVKITPTCDNANVFIQGPGNILITLPPGQTTATSTVATYSITANRLAPGLQLMKCKIIAKAEPLQGTAVPASNADEANFQVTVDYFPYIQAKLTAATLDAGPQKPIPFGIQVSNFGNARTQVLFQMSGEVPEKWQNIILPPALTLDSPNAGGAKTEDTATFTVNTPYQNGWNNDEQSFTITMTPYADIDQSKVGTPISVGMFARSRGIYVPGPEPILLGLALIGAAFVAKMARRDD